MKLLRHFRAWAIGLAVIMMFIGFVMLIWPSISALAICYLLGTVCVATGLYELIRYLRLGSVGILFRNDLLISILSMVAGFILYCHPLGVMTILPIILGFYIIIIGVFAINTATESLRFGMNNWWKSLLFGIISIILGLLMIVNPFAGTNALMRFIGVALIITGLEKIYVFYSISMTFKSDGHKKIIDAEWNEVD